MSLAKTAAFFEEFIDNRLNPILVRELRQMVRSRFIVVMLNLYVGLLTLVCLGFVMFSAFLQEEGTGLVLFGNLAAIMGFSSFFVVILYTGIVTASERINADLMYASAIKPWQVVLGKFFSGLILSLLLFSAVFPFFTLAYLLRGLDFYTFLTTTYLIFLAIHTANSVVLFLACALRTMVQMIFAGFLFFFFFFPSAYGVIGTLVFVGSPFLGSGLPGYWEVLIYPTLFSLSIIGFFLIAGIVIVSPPSSNRMLPMRLFLSLWFLLSFAFVLYLKRAYGTVFTNPDIVNVWCVLHLGMLTAFIVFFASERDTWNFRIRRTIPRFSVLRLLVFPFYTGAACGLVWWLGYLGAIAVVLALFGDLSDLKPYYFLNTFCLVLFVFNHFYTAMILRTKFFSRRLTSGQTWIVALLLGAVLSLGSALVYFLITFQALSFLERYDESYLSILNPFQLMYQLDTYASSLCPQSYGALLWTAVLTPYLIYWVLARWVHFSPKLTEEDKQLMAVVEQPAE
ncbi:MAG: hypothetical protein FWC43_06590 [Planctomycetaceae bacterium]|nr:hypothetical protein [Planctomycetaceae bacterium]